MNASAAAAGRHFQDSHMANELYIYTTPADAFVALTLDTGQIIEGLPASVQGRADAHLCQIPAGTTAQGAVLEVQADGFLPFSNRGLIIPAEDDGPAWFALDDVRLAPVATEPPAPEPPPPPDPSADPDAIVSAVYAQGSYDLSTKEGCGRYTEACVEALHAQQSAAWGHIRKTPSQNHWQGHAVDAVLLLVAIGDTAQGCYDIIWSTESPEAKPLWTYKGADPNAATIWYYGPMPCPPL